tara:strand:- start:60064 stop:61344 length:1281 start_codon:yes stop_codon:yes gene_type:complete
MQIALLTSPAAMQHSRRISVGAYLRAGLVGGVVIGVLMPALIRIQFFFNDPTGSFYNSLIATSIALVIGYYLYNKFIVYPARTSYSHVFPVFGSVYGLMFFVLVMFRIEYSRYQLLMSLLFALLWFYGLIYVSTKTKKILVGLVPGGTIGEIRHGSIISTQELESPVDDPALYDAIVADFRADLGLVWEKYVAQAALAGIPVYHVKQFSELSTGSVQLEHLSENSFGTIIPSLSYARAKRLVDLVLALIMLVPFAAIILISALLIKLSSRGPVFFIQERMGFRGKVFKIIKLRTMEVRKTNGHSYTEANDPRVTRVGAVFRKFRIDEFPQIINIFAGQMSWIGPRPEAIDLSEQYEGAIPFYSYRHIVRPGITGWAQVNQGNVWDVEAATTKLHYDFYYIKYFSPWLDVMITVKTIAIMLTGFGSR